MEYTLQETPKAAEAVTQKLGQAKVMTLTGDLGAGKTTLVKALGEIWGVTDDVNSPTFSLVNEYLCEDGSTIFHLDLYRLNDIDEALGMGIEEYLYSGNIVIIEWPEVIESLLPDECLRIHIEHLSDTSRKMLFL